MTPWRKCQRPPPTTRWRRPHWPTSDRERFLTVCHQARCSHHQAQLIKNFVEGRGKAIFEAASDDGLSDAQYAEVLGFAKGIGLPLEPTRVLLASFLALRWPQDAEPEPTAFRAPKGGYRNMWGESARPSSADEPARTPPEWSQADVANFIRVVFPPPRRRRR